MGRNVTYRSYSVLSRERGPLLEFLLDSLQSSGCMIIRHTPPNEAPFRFTFETPAGERLGVVAYAFFANSKVTKNRPDDEWRFQVKYGAKDGKLHGLWLDPFGLYTTLFVGVNPDRGLVVGADPQIHNPTKFFISVEFKESHADAIRKSQWHAWERDRRKADVEPVEVLVGCTGSRLLDYIRFERAAQGLDQGHRQLLAERWLDREEAAKTPPTAVHVPSPREVHALAREFEMPERDVLDLIASARRLKMAVRGWVAEEHVVKNLQRVEGVTDCRRLDDEGGPDVSLCYRGSNPITVQCKNVLRVRAADGTARMDFQKTRASKADPCSRYYRPQDANVLAACLHAVTERWEFRYVLPESLEPHRRCPGRLANNVRIDTRWQADARPVLEAAAG